MAATSDSDFASNNKIVSYVLQSIDVVIKTIFTFLPMKSLQSSARVCKKWNEISKQIKKSRKSTSWFFHNCLEDDPERDNTLLSELEKFFQSCRSEPSHVIMFCSTNLYEEDIKIYPKSQRLPRSSKAKNSIRIRDLIMKHLPKACKLTAFSSDGIVGTNISNRTTEIESGHAFTLLLLPALTDLTLYPFDIDIYKYASDMDDMGTSQFDVANVSTIPQNVDLKAILFISDQPFCPNEIGYSLLQHFQDTIIAGGYVDNIISTAESTSDMDDEDTTSLACLAFCGSRLRAASVILKEDVRTEKKVTEILKKLKDCNFKEERSFCFMFACVGRGASHYQKENVESSVFKKLFPQTPLFGFFGNGEIGFEFMKSRGRKDSDEGPLSKKTKQGVANPHPKMYHAFTTIFCLMSLE